MVVNIQGSVAVGWKNSHCLWIIFLVGLVAHTAAVSYQQAWRPPGRATTFSTDWIFPMGNVLSPPLLLPVTSAEHAEHETGDTASTWLNLSHPFWQANLGFQSNPRKKFASLGVTVQPSATAKEHSSSVVSQAIAWLTRWSVFWKDLLMI